MHPQHCGVFKFCCWSKSLVFFLTEIDETCTWGTSTAFSRYIDRTVYFKAASTYIQFRLDFQSIGTSHDLHVQLIQAHQIQWSELEIWLVTPHWHPEVLGYSHFKKLKVVDNLLLDHVGLPHVLVLVVHLVHFVGWMGRGDFFTISTFFLELVKSYCWWVGGPCDYCDSLSLKIWILDLGLRLWTQTLDPRLQALDLGLWTQACQFFKIKVWNISHQLKLFLK